MSRITMTHFARNLADIVNRVAYAGETFTVMRGKRPVAEVSSASPGRRLDELPELVAQLPELSPFESWRLNAELEAIRDADRDQGG